MVSYKRNRQRRKPDRKPEKYIIRSKIFWNKSRKRSTSSYRKGGFADWKFLAPTHQVSLDLTLFEKHLHRLYTNVYLRS
jgi:hypothetical protein